MKGRFQNIDRKRLRKNSIRIIIFIFLLYVFSKWNSIEEFFKSYF